MIKPIEPKKGANLNECRKFIYDMEKFEKMRKVKNLFAKLNPKSKKDEEA